MSKIVYIPRVAEQVIDQTLANFKVLYLSGARQVGKTTLLRHLGGKRKVDYVTLDDLSMRAKAKKDPGLFLDQFSTPLLIDEAQYAPELFPAIKLRADRSTDNGQYWLTGSQHFSMIRHIQESLAGRIGILSLAGLAFSELHPSQMQPHKLTYPVPFPRLPNSLPLPLHDVMSYCVRGTLPALWQNPQLDRDVFYQSYLQTYIDSDVSALFHVSKLSEFHSLLQLCAARIGCILNVSELARDAGISVHAAKEWLSIVEQTGIIYLLRPYAANLSLRLIKSPKLYFLDLGLANYLTGWPSASTVLKNDRWAGAVFECFVISELVKAYWNRGTINPPLYYYRNREGREVDVVVSHGQQLFPIEIKMSKTIRPTDIQQIQFLKNKLPNVGTGYVISLVDRWEFVRDDSCIALSYAAIQ